MNKLALRLASMVMAMVVTVWGLLTGKIFEDDS
jgi:hypothetical protein